MKTNFLSKQASISLLFSVIFLMTITSHIFSQGSWTLDFATVPNCPEGNITSTTLPTNHSFFPDMNSCDNEAIITLSGNQNFTTRVKVSSAPVNGTVHFRFGVKLGNATKSYSVRYYIDIDGNYQRRLYFDKGYVNLDANVMTTGGIQLYGQFNPVASSYRYMLKFDNKVLECGNILNAAGTIESFISTYGRPNDGGTQLLHQLNSNHGFLPACPQNPCENYDIHPDYADNPDGTPSNPPACVINRKTTCQTGLFPLPWPTNPFGGNKIAAESGENAGIGIYPNPTNDLINVNLNIPVTERIELKIIDSTGKLVYHATTQVNKGANLIQVDVATLPAGIYYVKVGSKYEFETQKFTILR